MNDQNPNDESRITAGLCQERDEGVNVVGWPKAPSPRQPLSGAQSMTVSAILEHGRGWCRSLCGAFLVNRPLALASVRLAEGRALTEVQRSSCSGVSLSVGFRRIALVCRANVGPGGKMPALYGSRHRFDGFLRFAGLESPATGRLESLPYARWVRRIMTVGGERLEPKKHHRD